MDKAARLIEYLDAATSIPWYHNAPVDAPAEYGTLKRDGGPVELVRDLPMVTFIVHAPTRGRAAELADEARDALFAAQWDIPNLFDVVIEGAMHDPLDGETGRYRLTAVLTFND